MLLYDNIIYIIILLNECRLILKIIRRLHVCKYVLGLQNRTKLTVSINMFQGND